MPDGSPQFVISLDEIIATCRSPADLERRYAAYLAQDGTCARCTFRNRNVCDAHIIHIGPSSPACAMWEFDGELSGAALRAEMEREAREIDGEDGDVGCSGMQGDA